MSEYFPKPKSFGANVKVELDLSNCTTKADLKNASGVDTVKKHVQTARIKNIQDKKPDITNFDRNDGLDAKINDVKGEIPIITNLATNSAPNAKTNEVKIEIPSITNWATTTTPTAVENKMPNVSDLVNKAGYDAEIKYIKNKYFNKSDYEIIWLMNNIFHEIIVHG